MKISGFTFIRNAEKFDYPVVESICSILPICTEFVVAIGNSEDNTEALIRNIHSDKMKIIHTVWDDNLRTGGKVLAVETDKAYQAIESDTDWCIYIQADEVLHEQYLQPLYQAMQTYKDDTQVEGLLLNYLHFYGNYQYIADSRKWYKKEIRVIRKSQNIRSYKDAQGFRKTDGQKLKVKQVDAFMYHYGWVKDPYKQQQKALINHRFWHSDAWIKENVSQDKLEFDYSGIDSLIHFDGSHPKTMQTRIENMNWRFEHEISQKKLSFKNKILLWLEKNWGLRIGQRKNYTII